MHFKFYKFKYNYSTILFYGIVQVIFIILVLKGPLLHAQKSLEVTCSINSAQAYLNIHKTEISEKNPTLETARNLLSCVVEGQLTSFYPEAEKAYFRTLLQLNSPQASEDLQKELNHTMLIADQQTKEKFEDLSKSNSKQFVSELTLFWQKRNPNPEIDYNIRFFEHWNRLTYAKSNFRFRKNSVIETDDRGPIFVKYGDPAKKYSGILPFSSQKVRRYLREFDVLNTGWSGNQELNNAFLSNLISQYYTTPRYEVWIYKGVTPDNLIYLFGNEGNTGQFGLRRSLEDMIPSNSFRASDEFRRFNAGPSLFLQLMMYEHFSMYDPFFNDAFSQLESQLLSIVNISSPEFSRSRKHIHESKLAQSQYIAPQQQSDYLSMIYELDAKYKSFRTFNEKGEAIFYSFIFVEIPETLDNSQLYPIRFSVFDHSELMNGSLYDSTFYSIPDKNIILSYQDYSMKSRSLNSYSDEYYLKGHFSSTQISHNLLNPSTTQEESEPTWVGDLILGKRQKEQNLNYDNDLVPFNISVQNLNADTEILTFYVGVKNIAPAKQIFQYQIEVELNKKDRRFLFIPLSSKSNFIYSLTSETDSPSTKEIIEIDITDLSPGKYDLIIKLTNSFESIPVLKTATFQIE